MLPLQQHQPSRWLIPAGFGLPDTCQMPGGSMALHPPCLPACPSSHHPGLSPGDQLHLLLPIAHPSQPRPTVLFLVLQHPPLLVQVPLPALITLPGGCCNLLGTHLSPTAAQKYHISNLTTSSPDPLTPPGLTLTPSLQWRCVLIRRPYRVAS